MKKQYGLDGLFSRPTGVNVEEEAPETPVQERKEEGNSVDSPRKVGRPRKPEGERVTDRKTRVTFLGSNDTMAKIRAIAMKEQLPISDVIDTALCEIIRRYEKKHGPVSLQQEEKQAKSLLDVL